MQAQTSIRVNVLGHGVVEFPAGTPEDVMRQALEGLSTPEPQAPAAPASRQYPAGHKGADSGIDPDVAIGRVRQIAPAAASIGAAYATGGMSIPIQMAAAGAAGAAGQAFQDAPEDMPLRDRFSNMAVEGLKQAAIQGPVALAPEVVPPLQRWARSLWNRSAKVTEQVAKKTQTMRAGGSPDAGKDEIAETVLSLGTGTLRRGNVDKMRTALNALDDQIDAIIVNSNKLVSRRDIAAAIRAHMADFTKDTAPGVLQRDALAAASRLLNRRAPWMTVQEAQKAKREIYDFYQKSYPAGSSETAAAMAEKTKGRALREAIASVEPDVVTPNAQMSKLIPATAAMENAVSRTGNHNLVGLSQMLAGAVPNPATIAAALLNNPKVNSFGAQVLYNAAMRLPSRARTAANIIRMASLGASGEPIASHETGR